MKHKLFLVFALVVLVGLVSVSAVSAGWSGRAKGDGGFQAFGLEIGQLNDSWRENKPDCGLFSGESRDSEEWLEWREEMLERRQSIMAERLEDLSSQGLITPEQMEERLEGFSSPRFHGGSHRRMGRGYFNSGLTE